MISSAQPATYVSASCASAADRDRLGSRLFTIGHSNHELDRFVSLLGQAGVAAVADVRSSPFSQRLPQYNQPELRRALESRRVGYIDLGAELGGRPRDLGLYDGDGRVDYFRVRQTSSFRNGLDRLLVGVEQQAIALMCAEEDPLDCHRGLMICPDLVEKGICPRHLRGDESIETTAQFEARLLDVTGVGRGMLDGLFAASITPQERTELLREACRRQAHRRGFRLPAGAGVAAIDATEELIGE